MISNMESQKPRKTKTTKPPNDHVTLVAPKNRRSHYELNSLNKKTFNLNLRLLICEQKTLNFEASFITCNNLPAKTEDLRMTKKSCFVKLDDFLLDRKMQYLPNCSILFPTKEHLLM